MGLSADVVHFPANLLKIEQSIGIFNEGVIGIILKTQMCQIHHSGIGGAADALFHGFGVITELGAQLDEGHVTGSIPVGDHVVHHIDDVLASNFANDAQPL